MDTFADDTNVAIGRHVRLEREARGWSLAELAAHAGVSKAAISKLERGETSPTATVLVRLATAFDLTLAGLLVRAEAGVGRLVRAADQHIWRDPASGYVRRQVFVRPDHPLEVAVVDLPPGRRVTMPARSHAGLRQVVWVTEGRLVVEDDGSHDLGPGDCLAFGPPAAVTFANATTLPVRYVVLIART